MATICWFYHGCPRNFTEMERHSMPILCCFRDRFHAFSVVRKHKEFHMSAASGQRTASLIRTETTQSRQGVR